MIDIGQLTSKLFTLGKPKGYPYERKPVMTWAPSHVEIGLLGELLRYANIIDGLGETEKRELRKKLELFVEEEGEEEAYRMNVEDLEGLMMEIPKSIEVIGAVDGVFFCVELCPEYIDYLKKVLKPYI